MEIVTNIGNFSMISFAKIIRGGQYFTVGAEFAPHSKSLFFDITFGSGCYFLFRGCGIPLMTYRLVSQHLGWNVYALRWRYSNSKAFWFGIEQVWLEAFSAIQRLAGSNQDFYFTYNTRITNVKLQKKSYLHVVWRREGFQDKAKEDLLLEIINNLATDLDGHSQAFSLRDRW